MSTEEIETQPRQNASAEAIVENSHVDVPPATTPSKTRFDLGPASDYYFKYVNSSAKKVKRNDQSFVSVGKSMQCNDDSTVNSSAMIGLESLLGDGGEDTETSMISIGANSSGSSSRDLMDKSTLSDTTELTAANFVLAATSRQKLNHVTKSIPERTTDTMKTTESDCSKKNGFAKAVELQNKENNENRSEPEVSNKTISALNAQTGATPGQRQALADHLQQSHEKANATKSSKEEENQLSSANSSSSPTSPVSKPAKFVEQKKLETTNHSPESTVSEGPPSQSSIADESIASLSAFESLFDDLPTEDVSSARRSRRMSSMPPRKSSIARLLEDDDDKLLSNGAISPEDSESVDKKLEKDDSKSEQANIPNDSMFTSELPVISETKWQELPSPPPPNKKGGLMFQLTPSSHKKPIPTKLTATPQRVTNVATEVEVVDGTQGKYRTQSSDTSVDIVPDTALPTTGVRNFLSQNHNEKAELSMKSPVEVPERSNQIDHTPSPPAEEKRIPSFHLTPNSHVKPTPTKLSKSPRRVLNPKAVDSPARNTRSNKKTDGKSNILADKKSDSQRTACASPEQALLQVEIAAPATCASESGGKSKKSIQQEKRENQKGDSSEVASNSMLMDESDSAGDEDVVDDPELHANLSAIRGNSRGKGEKQPESPDSMPVRETGASMIRLTPNSHVKPTPTKIQPSPRRVPNPRASPRRLTRSSRKASAIESDGDTASAVMARDLLGGISTGKRKKSDATGTFDDIQDILVAGETDHFSLQKRRKSTVPPSQNGKMPHDQSDSLILRAHPSSILSSKKRRSLGGPKLSVAFGSPDAAEYHVGSPSFSLTPMPRGRVKAMYPVPKATNHSSTTELQDVSINNGETVEMEANLNELVSNMQGSPGLSPIANVNERGTEVLDAGATDLFRATLTTNSATRSDTMELSMADLGHEDETVALEPGIDKVLEKAEGIKHLDSGISKDTIHFEGDSLAVKGSSQLSESNQSSKSKDSDHKSPSSLPMNTSDSSSMDCSPTENYAQHQFPEQDGQMTVEIEPNVNALIQATQLGSYGAGKDSEFSPNESFQFTDGQSIASMSMNSRSAKSSCDSPPLLSAHKLDFQSTASRKLDLSMDIEAGQTVELENNMTGLINVAAAATAGVYEKLSMSRLQQPPSQSEETMDDISDNASQDESFMDTQREVSGLDMELSESTQNSHLHSESGSVEPKLDSNSFVQADSTATEAIIVPVTMTAEEIMAFTGLNKYVASSLRTPNGVDAIVQISQSAIKENSPFVRNAVGRFVLAVCGEVESNTRDNNDSAKILVHPLQLENIREGLKTSTDGEIDHLFHNVKGSVESEWNNWISSVLASFPEAMHKSLEGLSLDFSTLNSDTQDIGSSCADLKKRANKSINHSRGRAIARRNATVASLEQEIEELQSHIEACRLTLRAKQDERNNTDSLIRSIHKSGELKQECDTLRPQAVSSQKEVLSLKGLHTWNASALQEDELSFCFPGHSPKTSIAMSFGLSDSCGTVKLTARVEPNCFRRNQLSSRKYSDSTMQFLGSSTKSLIGSKMIPSPAYIGLNLQQFEYNLGRLDLIAFELENLRRRYRAKLCKEERNNCHLIVVEFSKLPQKILTTFKLLGSYPATPLDFSIELLDGTMDVNVMKKTIVKKVKPGYWCMTRACDVVVALLRNQES